MNASLRQLRAFDALARSGSFTRAAERLHVSQPALTVQIRGLEAALGVRLFDRNTRSVRLTAIGAELHPAVERLLRDLEAVATSTRELAAGSRGVVHVAALPSVASSRLPAAIAALKRGQPGITVRLHDVVAQRVLALVRNEEVDFGIGGYEKVDAGLELAPLFVDRLEAVMPARHPLAQRERVGIAELARMPLVMMDSQSGVRALVERELQAHGHAAVPAYEVTYMSTAIGLVRAGLGIALLPTSAVELEMLGSLRRRPVAGAAFTRRIGIVRKKGRTLSPAAEALVKALRDATRVR